MDLYGRVLHDVLFPGFEALRGRPTVSLLRYLDRTQWASRDELHAIQSGYLRRLLRHAFRHTTYYRQVLLDRGLRPEDIATPADLAKLPLLDKQVARATDEARTADVPPFAVIHKQTSGSTGQPMKVSYNAESRHWRDAIRWRAYGWAGYRPGVKALHFWGALPHGRLEDVKIAIDRALNRNLYVDCQIQSDAQLQKVVDEIRRYRPGAILAYAQAGATLARYINERGARAWGTIPIILGAERLFDHDRAAMVQAFGDAYETYGCREVQLIGSECPDHDGLHTSMEMLVVEVVVRNPDGSVRAAKPGETGEIALTDLHNLANPLIRYVNGDLAVARAPERCRCGRWLDRIGPIEGRVTDMLRDGRGNKVNGILFSVLFVAVGADVKQFQAVQHKDARLTIKVVPKAATLPEPARKQIDEFVARYLPGVPVTVELVDDIPTSAAGKRRLVIAEA